MKKLFYLLFFIVSINSFSATYYVATTGNNGNVGSLSSPWATLTYAAGNSSAVVAGDTVYIKAGSYGNENIVCTKIGTADNKVLFIGYTTTPGDQPTVLVRNSNPYAAYSTSVMPTFTGSNRTTGIALSMTAASFVEFRNLQISTYEYGVVMGAADTLGNNSLYNVNCMTIGSTAAAYSGQGILLGSMGTSFSDYNTIEFCLVVNCCAEGINLNGDYNIVDSCRVFCNETTANASMDYFVSITGNHNIVINSEINRTAAAATIVGHGFTMKSNAVQVIDQLLAYPTITAQYNRIINCRATNMGESYVFRHRTVKYNLVYHCTATGTHLGSDASSGIGSGCLFRDGASDNIVDGLTVDSCNYGIGFDDSVEDGDTGGSPPGHPGNNNKVINSTISNCYTPVKFSIDGTIASDAGDNLIANCTFYLTRYLFFAARRCTLMRYEANIFYGNSAVGSGGYFRGDTYATDVAATQFTDCSFFNQQGGMPGGFVAASTNGLTTDPVFVNGPARDFHLQVTSPCINTASTAPAAAATETLPFCQYFNPYKNELIWGCNTKYHRVLRPHKTRDYDGVICPQGSSYDRGAFEYH